MKSKILLLGSYGRGNLGDDLLLYNLVKFIDPKLLRINCHDKKLLIKDLKDLNLNTIPTTGRMAPLKLLSSILWADKIVYGGGDLWVLLYENRFKQSSLIKMLAVNLLTKFLRKKIYYIGVGVGQLTGLNMKIAKMSARLADGIAVRERRSAKLFTDLDNITSATDPVFGLSDINRTGPYKKNREGKFVVGVNVMHHVPNHKKSFPLIIESLTASIKKNQKNVSEVIILPFLIDSKDKLDDVSASKILKARLDAVNIKTTISNLKNLKDIETTFCGLDLLVSVRLHGAVLGHLYDIPTVGISYRPKVHEHFSSIKLKKMSFELDELSQLHTLNYKEIVNNNAPVNNNSEKSLILRKVSKEWLK